MGLTRRLVAALGRWARASLQPTQTPKGRTPRAPSPASRPTPRPPRPTPASGYPGDFAGMPRVSYAPNPGRLPDPGEVVWTWVPYEEDHTQGKDRPVLLVGRDGAWLLGLPLTSEDHDRDAAQEASEGRFWMDIGTGPWDSRGRPSEVRLNRVVRVDPDAVRRVSGRLPRETFKAVAEGMRDHLG